MMSREHIRQSFDAAIPIMLGYVAIGVPCGILCGSIGLNALQVFLLSALFYSGAGQFMIPNMYLAASPLASIIASVSLVNTRQVLYSASFAPECEGVSKGMAFLFAATVTDESYGVSIARFREGGWSVGRALAVNLFSQSSWALSNVAGVLVGGLVDIPLQIAAFAMTSIFICLLFTQRLTSANVVAAVSAVLGVYACKLLGFGGAAILVGALLGVAVAMAFSSLAARRGRSRARECPPARKEREESMPRGGCGADVGTGAGAASEDDLPSGGGAEGGRL